MAQSSSSQGSIWGASMARLARRSGLFGMVAAGALAFTLCGAAQGQVFTVGEKTATADLNLDFSPTRVELPATPMTDRGRRDLVRNLEAEQGFAHRVLPLGSIVTLHANGNIAPGTDAYKQMVYKKGQAASAGDRVAVTAIAVKGDHLLIDLNGGPYPKHRFLSHIQIGVGGVGTNPTADQSDPATGCRILLVFEGGVPELSAPEVKALLEPLIDFGVKSGEQAYAETLPNPVKSAIASHEVLVGMNHRMVLAALGQPESKIRETATEGRYEEWIYGHQPQTVKFVRFSGDRVSLIKIAALGKPMEVHDQDEMAGYLELRPVRAITVSDGPGLAETSKERPAPPSLKIPGEPATPADNTDHAQRKVQFPTEHRDAAGNPASVPQDHLEPSLSRF